jgi:hypothetical protein
MNNQTTYTLLVRSEEKSRDVLETAAYAMCLLSVVIAMGQFVGQSSKLADNSFALATHAAPIVSQQAVGQHTAGKI